MHPPLLKGRWLGSKYTFILMFLMESITPLGFPVEPEVYMMAQVSSRVPASYLTASGVSPWG